MHIETAILLSACHINVILCGLVLLTVAFFKPIC